MPRLDLRGTGIIDSKRLDAIPSGDDVVQQVRESMRKCGIPEIPAPKGEPPVNLTEIDTTSLGPRDLEDLYIKYTSYSQFISTIHAERLVALKTEENRLRLVRAHVSKNLLLEGTPKSNIVAARDSHSDVEAALSAVLYTRTEKTLVEAAYKAFNSQAKALSRVVEIRKLEYEQTVRQGSAARNLKPINRLDSRKARLARKG